MKTIGVDISVLNDRQKTGIGVYTANLLEAILKINSLDKFILFGISTMSTYSYLKNLDFGKRANVEMRIFKWPAKLLRQSFLIWQKLNWPPIEAFIGDVDIFHSFNWFMPPQKRGKKVATVFDITSIKFPQWHDRKTSQLDRLRFKKIAADADLAIAISESTKKDFLEFHPRGRVEVIYPGKSESFNTKFDEKKLLKTLQKYNLQKGYFLSVSTLEPRKNLERLINVFLKVGINAPLVLVGKMGWKNDQLLQLIKSNPDRVKMLGFVPDGDLKALYEGALCLVYPSLYEGFGIPVVEAMSLGTPVITSNISSLSEAGGDAVLYINPYEEQSLAKALVKVYQNDKLRQKLSMLGLKQAGKFSWEKSAQKLNLLYQSL